MVRWMKPSCVCAWRRVCGDKHVEGWVAVGGYWGVLLLQADRKAKKGQPLNRKLTASYVGGK